MNFAMDLTQLPFNDLIGIDRSDRPDALLCLHFDQRLTNHLGTVHASALFALAEASSAEFLMRCRGDRDYISGVVRKAQSKYAQHASADVHAATKTSLDEIESAIAKVDAKGRALVSIDIDLHVDTGLNAVASFTFDWFLAKTEEP